MTSKRVYLDYLKDIADAAEKIAQFIEGMTYGQFVTDAKTSFAVVRALEVIGEAAKQVPSSIRTQYPEVPWQEMSGMRDKLVHDYFGVNLEVVWKTALEDVPNLGLQMQRILMEMDKP